MREQTHTTRTQPSERDLPCWCMGGNQNAVAKAMHVVPGQTLPIPAIKVSKTIAIKIIAYYARIYWKKVRFDA